MGGGGKSLASSTICSLFSINYHQFVPKQHTPQHIPTSKFRRTWRGRKKLAKLLMLTLQKFVKQTKSSEIQSVYSGTIRKWIYSTLPFQKWSNKYICKSTTFIGLPTISFSVFVPCPKLMPPWVIVEEAGCLSWGFQQFEFGWSCPCDVV